MKKRFSMVLASIVAMLLCAVTTVSADSKPTIRKFIYSDNSIVEKISDNGEWAIAVGGSTEAQENNRPRLINLSTGEEVYLQTTADVTTNGNCHAVAVSNDGSIVVGSYKSSPAYWSKSTGTWTTFTGEGNFSAVTADGHYAVGSINAGNEWMKSTGILYDLTTNTLISTSEGLQSTDMSHYASAQYLFNDISDDGRYILGRMSQSYPGDGCFCFIYDVQEKKTNAIGFTINNLSSWTAADDNLLFVDEAFMSNNGDYVTGLAYTTSDNYIAFKYKVATGDFEMYNESGDIGIFGYAIGDDGTILGTTPYSTPLREWYVRTGDYWLSAAQIFKQKYDMDFYTTTNYERTGYPTSFTSDGKSVVCTTDPESGESYMVTFPESLTTICEGLNLLGDYTVEPAEGATFARMGKVKITFTRDIALAGTYLNVALKDPSGNVVANPVSGGGVQVSGKVLTITFRATKAIMEAGKTYTLEIDPGTIIVKGDATKKNEKIVISYNGRDNKAVEVTNVYPVDNSEVSFFDYNSNPILLTFDADVQVADNASARLVNLNDNSTVCSLNMATSGKYLGVYPSARQYLFQGANYQVVIDAGSVTDVMGYNASSEIVLNYTGVYEREISQDDATLFFDDFSNTSQSYINFMRYEGDHLTPTSTMQDWSFDADNTPWNFTIRESNSSTDCCAASHSMYSPAGKSDDWMVIPQLNIPDEFCTLSFLAQSYKNSATDYLKVIIYESDENINALSSTTIEKMRSEGRVVFNEQLSPGATEEGLSGEWTKYVIDLAQYAGKNIYIAFLNENEDQSAIFVDSVTVARNLKYYITLSNAESVVNQESINIAGTLVVNSDNDTYTSVTLTLCDADGNQVGESITQTGLSLTKGSKVPFAFTTPLPLTKAAVNKFTIKVKLDDYSDTKTAQVKNLTFQPNKNVILEEMTGTTCPNCPLGILAIENLKKAFGSNIIPVSIHTYTGDNLGSGLSSYTTSLGLTAAPTGIVNRNGIISSPMWQSPLDAGYYFSDELNNSCWYDYVVEEMNTPADAEITADAVTIDETASTFSIPLSVRYALSANNLSLNVFVTVVEDGIVANQENNLYTTEDANFGDWGKGGKYSSSDNSGITHDDVCRAYYGSSIEGTSGYLPQSMTAGEPYEFTFTGQIPTSLNDRNNAKAVVMLLNSLTGKVINATVARLDGTTGIKGVSDNKTAGNVTVGCNGGNITVLTDGEANVAVYSVAGTQIASAKSNGTVTLSTGGYHGAAIVKVATENGTTVKKLIVR